MVLLLPIGLSDPDAPEWGGWGGRFTPVKPRYFRDATDTVGNVTDARATVWRWRPAFQADFQARMDWCVKPPSEANHPPTVALNGDSSLRVHEIAARPGDRVTLAPAGSTDSDGDRLAYRWFVYPEAGSYGQPVPLTGPDRETVEVLIPADAAGKTIHVICEVTDTGTPPLTRYRRAVLAVMP